MDCRQHKLSFPCPNCDKPITIVNLFANGKGELLLEGICIGCGNNLEVTTNLQRIIITCLELDLLAPMEMQMKVED